MKAIRLFALCAIAFMFIAAPIYMNQPYQVFINGHKFANAQNFNGNLFVSVADLSDVLGGTVRIQGNHLSLTAPALQASSVAGSSFTPAGAAGGGGTGVQAHGSGGGAGKVKVNEFTIKKTTDMASPLVFHDGVAFVKLDNIAGLFGGTLNLNVAALKPGQTIQLNFSNSPGATLACFPPIGTR